jgi:hypothetical protein
VKFSQFLIILPDYPALTPLPVSSMAALLGAIAMASPSLAAPDVNRLDLPLDRPAIQANLLLPPSAPLTVAANQSDPETAAETVGAEAEAAIWPTPAELPPPEPIAPTVRTAPLGIPTANSTPPPPATRLDDELGSLTIQPIPADDEDFGQLPTRLVPPPQPKAKWLFVNAQAGYFANSNSFYTTTQNGDGSLRAGVGLVAQLPLWPKTYLTGSINSNFVRNLTFSQQSYDEVRLRAGILQQLSPRMFGEIGWSNQNLYAVEDGFSSVLAGDRVLNEHSIYLDLNRTDPIGKGLSLSNFYQLRWSLSSRPEGDRLSNTVFTSLNQRLSPRWTASLDYLLSWSHYTQVARDEVFQLVQLRTQHQLGANLSVNLFGGFSFGGSSDRRARFGLSQRDRLNYDGWSFGVNFVYGRALF